MFQSKAHYIQSLCFFTNNGGIIENLNHTQIMAKSYFIFPATSCIVQLH